MSRRFTSARVLPKKGQIPEAVLAEAMTDGEGHFALTGLWGDPALAALRASQPNTASARTSGRTTRVGLGTSRPGPALSSA